MEFKLDKIMIDLLPLSSLKIIPFKKLRTKK
jgi:hypothetical protein